VTGEILTVDGGQSLTSNNYNDYMKELAQSKSEGGGGFAGVFGSGK
jgi:hypothetical protein